MQMMMMTMMACYAVTKKIKAQEKLKYACEAKAKEQMNYVTVELKK